MKTGYNNLSSFIPLITCVVQLCLITCSENTKDHISSAVGSVQVSDGMRYFNSSGEYSIIGSNASALPDEESPAMEVLFTYNFYIDTAEVTAEEYKELTGSLPAQYSDLDTINYNAPVRFVSWYDAVLFCNLRSKRKGLDTVYTYESTENFSDGGTNRLTGLETHFSRNGYRLPTEAEWEYSYKSGDYIKKYYWENNVSSNTASAAFRYAVFSGNSGNSPESICSKPPNSAGLYDMAGNIMEWTNDIMAGYADKTIRDFVGGISSPGNQLSVKGGSFSHGIKSLRVSARSDIYTTSPSMRTEYLGFRCARGSISDPVYLSGGSQAKAGNPVWRTDKSANSLLGTSNAKIAFVNVSEKKRTLFSSDLSSSSSVMQYTKTDDVYNPMISPDGRYAAYTTASEGSFSGLRSCVIDLSDESAAPDTLPDAPAYMPRWYVDTAMGDTFIVYSTSAAMNNTTDWKNSETRMTEFSGGSFTDNTEALTDRGSFTGGLSPCGRYLVSGYPKLKVLDIEADSIKRLFLYPENGKDADGNTQVCNASASPDIDRLMFLDFGSSTVSTITNDRYRPHQKLFISDYNGEITNVVPAPAEFHTWEATEWSTKDWLGVSAAGDGSGNTPSIFLIDVSGSSSIEVLRGTELTDPSLWISDRSRGGDIDISIDSAGAYDDPYVLATQKELGDKIRLFYTLKDSVEVIFLGSSRTQRGIDPRLFPNHVSCNLAQAGTIIKTLEQIIHKYIYNHAPNLKVVVFDLLIGRLDYVNNDHAWSKGVGQSKGFVYDSTHFFWKNGFPEDYMEAVLNYKGDFYATETYKRSGFSPSADTIKEASPEVYGGEFDVSSAGRNLSLSPIHNIVKRLNERGIITLLVIAPQISMYRSTPYYGKHGPTWESAIRIIKKLREMEEQMDGFYFYDAYKNGINSYNLDHFIDMDHLNTHGARKFSNEIRVVLDSVLTSAGKQ